jgi:hypothetical protein
MKRKDRQERERGTTRGQAGQRDNYKRGTGRRAGQLLKGDRQDSWIVIKGGQAGQLNSCKRGTSRTFGQF